MEQQSNLDDCIKLVTGFSSFDDLKATEPTYYPKFYSPATTTVERIAQRRVVCAWNAWALRHGRLPRAFVASVRGAQ